MMYTITFDAKLRRYGMFVLLDPDGKLVASFEHMYDAIEYCEQNKIEYVTE